MIPLFVIIFGQAINQLGMLDGDADGTPSYFLILLIATAFITFFLLNYIFLWNALVQYYMYGSIEATDREKEQRKKALLENEIEIKENN